jgi:hypothetical protein
MKKSKFTDGQIMEALKRRSTGNRTFVTLTVPSTPRPLREDAVGMN